MYSKRTGLVLLLAALFTTTACGARIVRGSGDLITETRQVDAFDSIALIGMGEVVIAQGGSESLSIETDDNVMEHVEVRVRGGTLELGFEEGVRLVTPTRLTFYVGVDDLTGLTISGSGDIESDSIDAGRLEVSISGSGDVQIADLTADEVQATISGSGEIDMAGAADRQEVVISGSGNYLAGDLCSASVKVTVSGSGNATVCASQTLEADISGSGNIGYYGRPALNSTGSGSGTVNSLGER